MSFKNKWSEFITSTWGNTIISAIVGASVSLATTVYLDNKNREINLKPYLNFGFKALDSNPRQYGVVIRNLGKGPAIIEKVIFKFNDITYSIDKNYNGNFQEDFLKHTNIDKSCKLFISSDYLIRPGDSIFENTEIGIISIPRQAHYSVFNEELAVKLFDRVFTYTPPQEPNPENSTKAMQYIIDTQYNKCRESFIEYFTPNKNDDESNKNDDESNKNDDESNKNNFSIYVEYKSLNDDEIYKEHRKIEASRINNNDTMEFLKEGISPIIDRKNKNTLTESDIKLLNDFGISIK